MSENGYVTNVNSAFGDDAVVPNSKFDEKNYVNTRLKDGENSKVVKLRILPISADNGDPYVEVRIHAMKVSKEIAKSGFKSYTCLNDKSIPNYNPEVKCPLCKKCNELYNQAEELKNAGALETAETIRKMAGNYIGKKAYILRCIVRGEENDGVKFWRFNYNSKGEGCMDKLKAIYKTRRDEYMQDGIDYNIFDLNNGRDLVLTINRVFDKEGRPTDKSSISITDSARETPLSNDIDLANSWISDPKKWADVYTVKSHDYLEIVAQGMIPKWSNDEKKYIGVLPKDSTTPVSVEKTAGQEVKAENQNQFAPQN